MKSETVSINDSTSQDKPTYSKIIQAEVYNQIISNEHLYIAAADKYIAEIIKRKAPAFGNPEVIELGCGPGRLIPLTGKIQNINLTCIDHDSDFIEYANKLTNDISIQFITNDISTYHHKKPVSIFYSQGFHHHVSKGKLTHKYLANTYSQLVSGGYYIISDEFIPNYNSEEERDNRLIVWYAHIISHALKDNYNLLAQEEAKTLLDDLNEGKNEISYKTPDQIAFVLSKVDEINQAAEKEESELMKQLISSFIIGLKSKQNKIPLGASSYDLSRNDYKICDKVFRQEIEEIGFSIESVHTFGPMRKNIGAMCVYVLKK